MNLNQRIAKIIEYSGFSSSEFADEVEVQRSSISHITSGRNKPSLDFLIKIKERFPELEWDWLIKGEGDMKKPEPTEESEQESPTVASHTSLPDLFSIIDDENFGITESEDRLSRTKPTELKIPEPIQNQTILTDSQRLEQKKTERNSQTIENQNNNIKRIVLFYENGKFESFEP